MGRNIEARAAKDTQLLATIGLQAEARAVADSILLERRLSTIGFEAGNLLRQGKAKAWEDMHKPAGMVLFPGWLMGAVAGFSGGCAR